MIKIITSIVFFVLFLGGCFSDQNAKENNPEVKKIDPGSLKINYYSNKTITPLDVPPDLTSPNYQKSFRLSEFTKAKLNENLVNFSDKEIKTSEKITSSSSEIEVKKSGDRRWLLIKKDPEFVWNLVGDFFKQEGFVIKVSNKKIGIMETDYLENKPEIPAQSVGLIRSMFQKALKARYSLPILDKFRVRIEPTEDKGATQLFLSVSSMQEVVTNSGKEDENTIWQYREKDLALEVEMLYKIMLHLGGDKAISRERILQAKEENTIEAVLTQGFNGYSKLVFNTDLLDTWDNFSWALDQIDAEIEDKDILEKSIYVNMVRTSDMGIFTKIFGDEAVKKTFKLSLRASNKNSTEVVFTDISGENEEDTVSFSKDFFTKIRDQFK